MEAFDIISDFAKQKNILVGNPLPISACSVIRPYKLEKHNCFDKPSSLTVYMLAVPYFCKSDDKNISSYAVPRDYHLYFSELFGELTEMLREYFPQNNFIGFADDSPIAEVSAAATSGLGVIGKNGMLITMQYSSYVFLGEIFSDREDSHTIIGKAEPCIGCGACSRACPMGETGVCLSELTQKKGSLSQSEIQSIKKYSSAWGCDICQSVCPYTKEALKKGTIYTPVPFFKENLISHLTSEDIEKMDDGEFSRRAYSWRKRETILRNLKILEKET